MNRTDLGLQNYRNTNHNYYAPTVKNGAISVAFVRPSVRLSVCLSVRRVHSEIIREPIGLEGPNLEGRFPTLDATRIPVSKSNGQRSGLEAGGSIPCRPNPACRHTACYIRSQYRPRVPRRHY